MDIESNIIQEEKPECTSDMFELQHWDFPSIQQDIVAMAVSSHFVYIMTKSNVVYRWKVGDLESLQQEYNLPMKDKEKEDKSIRVCPEKLSSIFCDSEGNHAIIKHNNKMYYFNGTANKIRELPGLKGIEVYSIAFDDRNKSQTTTNDILITDYDSKIMLYRIDLEKDGRVKESCSELISLKQYVDPKDRIYGIHATSKKGSENIKYVIAVTKTKLFQFTGGPGYKTLFESYKHPGMIENCCKIFPISNGKGGLNTSKLSMLYKRDYLASFGWMTESGFCFGDYPMGSKETCVMNFTIFPYVKIKKDGKKETDDLPIATCHTENHVFVLYSDCITVISKITSNIIHTQYFSSTELFYDMIYDDYTQSIWLRSTKSLYQMSLTNEDDNVWMDYLEIGDYKKALDCCQMLGLPHYKKISKLCGSDLFDKGDYQNAALNYASSDEKLEEVCLKFLLKNEYEGLKTYLQCVDESRLNEGDITQKHLIATWFVEILLNELNSTTQSNQIKNTKNSLIHWMREKNNFLDKDTIYQLLQHYGRVDEFIEFARIKKDYETIILHYINEKSIKKALEELTTFILQEEDISVPGKDKEGKLEELKNIFIRYSHSFMRYEPVTTIDLLMNKFQSIDPNKIISAIMSTEKGNTEQVLNYIRTLIKDPKRREKNIHNLYLFYLSKVNSDENNPELIEYLKRPLKKESSSFNSKHNAKEILFELDYAKKLFSQNNLPLSLVLALMGKYAEGVKTALSVGEKGIDIAKFIAKNVDDPKVQKGLWLQIFSFLNQEDKSKDKGGDDSNNKFKDALKIMEESKILKIEDVLPHIMDNIKIDEFKREISKCISVYENNIQSLKSDINEYNKTAEDIKRDIYKVKKRSMEIQYRQCKCEICNCNIKDDNIYLFPCGHMFDAKCIMDMLEQYRGILPEVRTKTDEVNKLKKEIDALERRKAESMQNVDNSNADTGFFSGLKKKILSGDRDNDKVMISNDELNKLSELKEKLSEILSEECVLCGDYMVESTQCSFNGDKSSWIIS